MDKTEDDFYPIPYTDAVRTFFESLGLCALCANKHAWEITYDDPKKGARGGGTIEIEGLGSYHWD